MTSSPLPTTTAHHVGLSLNHLDLPAPNIKDFLTHDFNIPRRLDLKPQSPKPQFVTFTLAPDDLIPTPDPSDPSTALAQPTAPPQPADNELHVPCKVCGVHLATVKLYGPPRSFIKPFTADLTCVACCMASGGSDVISAMERMMSSGYKRRPKRRANEERPTECNLCRKLIGVGGVRMVVDAVPTSGGAAVDARDMRCWVEPDFDVEFYCKDCLAAFRFCTSCGAKKSGKWRPKELFKEGRKTCYLPHIRLGNPSTFRHVVYRCPIETSPVKNFTPFTYGSPMAKIPHASDSYSHYIESFASEILESSRMFTLLVQAEAHTMRDFPAQNTWAKVQRREVSMRGEIERFIMGRYTDATNKDWALTTEVRRYFPVTFAPNPKLKRRKHQPAGVATGEMLGEPGSYVLGGWMCYFWNVSERHFCGGLLRNMGQVGLGPGSMLTTLVSSTLKLVLSELEADPRLQPPLHAWTWFYNRENRSEGQMKALLRKQGLMPLEEYADKIGMPLADVRAMFHTRIMEHEIWEDMVVFAGSWTSYLQEWSRIDSLLA
ncbi:hypothetical protein HK101_007880 [Irineochytrium annulatum]|nr:hypothetical protein HK101_007880 [Irineochytrium annulatum]